MNDWLIHVSEEPDIAQFAPRPSRFTDSPVVWAVDEAHLVNYLVPRDCPRVSFYALPTSAPDDVTRFLGSSHTVLAVEAAWLPAILACRLYLYHLPADSFECRDAGAGHYVSRDTVTPVEVTAVADPLLALARRQVEIRILPDLWTLRDAILASTLQFSFIRMRHAQPRTHQPPNPESSDRPRPPAA